MNTVKQGGGVRATTSGGCTSVDGALGRRRRSPERRRRRPDTITATVHRRLVIAPPARWRSAGLSRTRHNVNSVGPIWHR